jgi:serine-protein kinase ATM
LIDETLFSDGLNGPAGMSDAALSLWFTVIESGSAGGQSAAQQTVSRLLNWFSSHYNLSPSSTSLTLSLVDRVAAPSIDRVSAKQTALYATPATILKLLLLCTNVQIQLFCVTRRAISSSAFIAAFEVHRNAGLTRYLIQGQAPPKKQAENPSETGMFPANDRRGRETSNDHAVLEMLLLKLQNFREAWIALTKERASNVSADVLEIMVSLIVVSSVLPTLLSTERSQICKELFHSARQVWDLVYAFIRIPGDVGVVNASIAAATVTAVRSSEVIVAEDPVLQGLSFMLPSLLVQLHRNIDTTEESEKDDMEMIDIGDSFVSYSSQSTSNRISQAGSRQDLPFALNQHDFKRELLLQLHMYLIHASPARLVEEEGMPSTIEYLIDLRPGDWLASRSSISMFLRSTNLSNSDACRLLKSAAQACIQDYHFERCEASLCLCLEIMTILAELWVTDENDKLHEVASDMYEWFIKVPLGKGLASSRVLISLATLLQRVLNLNLTYNNASLPSSRTSLFEILRSGSNVVKFSVAEEISCIFDRFILTEHTAILYDVVESLPDDSTDFDGIALRLYVLAELAARWATLLRSSVYHMFETSAHVPFSVPHARNCLRKISSILDLESPRDLFLLFAPQLLYTWLETESLQSVPFSIYGFRSLSELIADVQDEVVGQIVMRANKALANELSEIMETPFDAMLESSFPKAEAYSVARDISMPPSKDNASKSTESQVRKQLGTDKYLRLVSLAFPQTVANLFLSLSDEHEIERALAKRPGFAFAATNLQSICRLSASKIVLPPGQQPSFRAKYLLDELEFLCARISKDQLTMWTSPLIIYVCRNLLDSVVPALGPLHACSMLRKIRVLVALAGQEALQGYTLEMLLHSLQPYLTRFYCAEDALGLFWYLLDQGRGHLQQNLSFLYGIALTTLLSLSTFLNAPQDSTTQESHYLSTISVTASFHKWFQAYLATFPNQNHTVDDANTFKKMIRYAGGAQTPGRADQDSVEGKLLLELLEVRTSERKILSPVTFNTAVQMLCRSFNSPAKPEDDILGQDTLAIRHSRVLWELLGDIKAPPEFWTWSGEILGRAYAASGVIEPTLTMEHSHDLFQPTDSGSAPSRTSRSLIVDNLSALLHSNGYTAASLAEKTLQQVITQVAHQRALDDYEDCFDLALIRALNWHTSHCPEMTGAQKYSLPIDEHMKLHPATSVAKWASEFLVSLTSSVRGDPLLGALTPILSKLYSLATRVLPFVVHSFLSADNKDGQPHREIVAKAFLEILSDNSTSRASQKRLVLSTLLYLRRQPLRKETTIADRSTWLNIDFDTAAAAAASCAMYKSALLLLELQASQQTSQSSRSSRRSSAAKVRESPDLLRQIYQSLDDPDFFYGRQEDASLSSVMRKLSHERNSFKNLSFQSAAFDSGIKASDSADHSELFGALVSANMNGVARAVQAQLIPAIGRHSDSSSGASFTALNLHQWDLPLSSAVSDPSSLLFQVFCAANTSINFAEVPKRLDAALLTLVENITQQRAVGTVLRHSMSALAALTETKEALSLRSSEELAVYWLKLSDREEWQETEE